MADFNSVVDSGKRQIFNTGSVRDTSEGKGMPHLIAGEALASIYGDNEGEVEGILHQIEKHLLRYTTLAFNKQSVTSLINLSIKLIIEYLSEQEGSYSGAMRRLAQHYENGSIKYDKNNWRKGQPVSRYYDSTMRHLWKEIDELKDEDHAAAIFWNLLGIIQTKIDVKKGLLPKELDDFPFTIQEVFGEKKVNNG